MTLWPTLPSKRLRNSRKQDSRGQTSPTKTAFMSCAPVYQEAKVLSVVGNGSPHVPLQTPILHHPFQGTYFMQHLQASTAHHRPFSRKRFPWQPTCRILRKQDWGGGVEGEDNGSRSLSAQIGGELMLGNESLLRPIDKKYTGLVLLHKGESRRGIISQNCKWAFISGGREFHSQFLSLHTQSDHCVPTAVLRILLRSSDFFIFKICLHMFKICF